MMIAVVWPPEDRPEPVAEPIDRNLPRLVLLSLSFVARSVGGPGDAEPSHPRVRPRDPGVADVPDEPVALADELIGVCRRIRPGSMIHGKMLAMQAM
jgi:hypothetical protein